VISAAWPGFTAAWAFAFGGDDLGAALGFLGHRLLHVLRQRDRASRFAPQSRTLEH
jgi:hypothetical protein